MLKQEAEKNERQMPLLLLKAFDETSQLKFYAKTYYSIIFSEFELNRLNIEMPLRPGNND